MLFRFFPPASLPEAVDTILKAGPAERSPSYPARIRLVSRPADLIARRVDLPKQSPYVQTLMEIEDSLSSDIQVVELDASDDKLIREGSKGNIQYTVAEGNVADLQQEYYRNLHVGHFRAGPSCGSPPRLSSQSLCRGN